MKKIIFLFVAAAIIGFVFISSAYAGWFIYSKPAFRGRVIDAETKKPIEGAVIVVLYYKYYLVGSPAGRSAHVLNAKETLTDENGEFYISSYFAITPLSEEDYATFIIFKPGYKSVDRIEATKLPDEKYFGIEKDMIGKEGEIKNIDMFGDLETWKGILGVVELERVSPDRAMPPGGIPADYGAKELPLLYRAINEDRRNRGLEGEVK